MRKNLLFISLFFSSIVVNSQVIVPFFTSMKESILPYVDVQARRRMIDLHNSGIKAEVPNKFGKSSELVVLKENYLKIKLSDYSIFEMSVFQHLSDNYIITINTAGNGSAATSIVTIYTGSWEKVRLARILPPNVTEACYKELFSADISRKKRYSDLLLSSVCYSFDPEKIGVNQSCFFEWKTENQHQDTLTVHKKMDIKSMLK